MGREHAILGDPVAESTFEEQVCERDPLGLVLELEAGRGCNRRPPIPRQQEVQGGFQLSAKARREDVDKVGDACQPRARQGGFHLLDGERLGAMDLLPPVAKMLLP